MASQNKVVHQDYIARIRYSNQLPPPWNPPKLLDIPGTGLAGGQYTSAAYASRLVREQPLNIEADAELGMPIDLIGIPGVFDGDERAISARSGAILHPADKALLKPLTTLGKAAAASGGASFLRRTEYTASQATQHFTSSTSKDLLKLRNDAKRKRPSLNKDDPINIMRNIVKGFDVAHPKDAYKGEDNQTNLRGAAVTDAELNAWSHPKHPNNPDLKLLDSYPVLPDLDAIPTTGFYMIMKFEGNPLARTDHYDQRLDTAIMRPEPDEEAEAIYQEKLAAWEESDKTKPEPIREYDYEYFIPQDPAAVHGIKRKLDPNDPDNDNPELYTDEVDEGKRAFKYTRLRTYETKSQKGDTKEYYNHTLAMAIHDPETEVSEVAGVRKRLQKGAYYYPIVQTTAVRPKRNVGRIAYQQEEIKIDELNITVADPGEELQAAQLEKRSILDPAVRTVEVA